MAFQITPEWLIDLPDEMEHRIEEDKLIFWKTGVTVAIVAFSVPDGVTKLELLAQIQQKMPEQTLETFVSTKGEVVGLGFTEVLKANDDYDRLSLVTFTASDTSCLQTGFFLDNPADLEWAKSVWEGILFVPEQKQTPVPSSLSDSEA
jgi:hypothetical protein